MVCLDQSFILDPNCPFSEELMLRKFKTKKVINSSLTIIMVSVFNTVCVCPSLQDKLRSWYDDAAASVLPSVDPRIRSSSLDRHRPPPPRYASGVLYRG